VNVVNSSTARLEQAKVFFSTKKESFHYNKENHPNESIQAIAAYYSSSVITSNRSIFQASPLIIARREVQEIFLSLDLKRTIKSSLL
jgi:hypothetical protein